jgi:hypothetical protein
LYNGEVSDGEESNGVAFDGDYIDKNNDDTEEHFIARTYDIAVKKSNLMLEYIKQGKVQLPSRRKLYLVKLKSKFGELFKPGYELIITKCKCDDQGRWVYEPRPMVDPDSQCCWMF